MSMRDGLCTITPDLKVLGPRPSAIAGEDGDLSTVLVGHGRTRLSEIDFIGVRTQRATRNYNWVCLARNIATPRKRCGSLPNVR
jgi:hypothetical protein